MRIFGGNFSDTLKRLKRKFSETFAKSLEVYQNFGLLHFAGLSFFIYLSKKTLRESLALFYLQLPLELIRYPVTKLRHETQPNRRSSGWNQNGMAWKMTSCKKIRNKFPKNCRISSCTSRLVFSRHSC